MEAFLNWLEGVPPLLRIALISITPTLELSGSIPYGLLATKLQAWQVVSAALLANWLVSPLAYLFMSGGVSLLRRMRWFEKLWDWYEARVREKLHKPMERWGHWGLLVLVAIPGPGSGLYTATIGAYLLGINLRHYLMAVIIGQIIAAALVTIAVMSGSEAFRWMIEQRALEPH
ncbi:small multi-drug export protein [bacterium]|nr:small multi-drug export protein [bacterium]